jgi:tetratricopeptide (TPR) repeat protein
MNHSFFLREPVFSKDVTGILVMRIVGDDALDSLQAAVVEKLNRGLQEEAGDQQIEVHAGRDRLDDSNGLPAAHQRAHIIGQRLNAKLVIWGRKIGEKEFYPYITVLETPDTEDWSAKSERAAVVVQNIAELHLPKEFEDELFYLIHFTAGYSYYLQRDYKEALVHYKAALQRKGGSPSELADLQTVTAFCEYSLAFGQERLALPSENEALVSPVTESVSANLQEAIGLYEKAAKGYGGPEGQNERKWARTQNRIGVVYQALPTGDRAANLQKAIAAYEAALRVYTEKDLSPDWDWLNLQNNLGTAYQTLPSGDRAANLQKAIAAYETASRVYAENDWWDSSHIGAKIQYNLGLAYADLPGGDYVANLQKAIAAYEAALRVFREEDFPLYWANVQYNLGLAYAALSGGEHAADLQKAKVCFEAALRVYTKSGSPEDQRDIAAHLANVERQLRNLTSE